MVQRHLILEFPPVEGKQRPARVQISVDDQTTIGPWVTTLAARLGYPLVDRFGSPVAYRLRSVSGETLLPMAGRFADVHFPSGSQFVLEPDPQRTEAMLHDVREVHAHRPVSAFRIGRRSLMNAGLLTTLSLLGFGSGLATAFAQRFRSQPEETTAPISLRSTTFRHHRHPVRTITWSPDEQVIASGDTDGVAFLWSMNGTILHTLQFHAPVQALALSPDGMQLAAGSATSVSFFDVQTGSLLAEHAGRHTAVVTSVGWTQLQGSPPLALSAGADTRAVVWNGQSHQPQIVFRHHTSAIEALAVLATTVATASLGGVARVWSATSGQEVHGYYSDSSHAFRAIAFSLQGTLAVGSDDGMVRLWNHGRICTHQIQDVFGPHCVDGALHLRGHTRPVLALAFSPDGALLATGGDDKKLIIWSVQKKMPVLIHDQHDALAALAWSPSGRFLAGATGSRVEIWHVRREEMISP